MIAVLPLMRFVSALLFVALTGSVTLADEAKPADPKPEVARRKVPLRVVKMLPETRQVLLLDKNKGTHVLAEVGQEVDGYIVDEIADDEVTLVSDTGAEVILTAPDHNWRRKEAERKAAAAKAAKAATPADPAPADPYADPADPAPVMAGDNGVRISSAAPTGDAAPAGDPASSAPADPYDDPAIAAFAAAVGATPSPSPADASASPSPSSPPARVASAPASAPPAARSTPTRAHPAGKPGAASTKGATDGASLGAAFGGGAATAPTVDATTSAAAAAAATAGPTASVPAIASSTTSPVAATAGPTTSTLKRAEIDAALADFSTTAASFRASFTVQGLRFDDVASGSLLAKAGLQKGDTVTTVDGQPLRSLDDAANLYARLPTARGTTLAVVRAGKPLTLRVAIQ